MLRETELTFEELLKHHHNKSVLQIKRSSRDNLEIIIPMFPKKNIFFDPSLEPSHRDGSNEGSQYMFSLRNKKKLSLHYPQYSLLSGALNKEGSIDISVKKKVFKNKKKATENKSVTSQICGKCGYTHKPRECSAFGKFCRNCYRRNHFAKKCKSKKMHELHKMTAIQIISYLPLKMKNTRVTDKLMSRT